MSSQEDLIEELRADNNSMTWTIEELRDEVRRLDALCDQRQEVIMEMSELVGSVTEDNTILADRNAALVDQLGRISNIVYDITAILGERA